MTPETVLLIVLALLLIGVLLIGSYSRGESHGFGGALGLAVFALPVLLVTGRL